MKTIDEGHPFYQRLSLNLLSIGLLALLLFLGRGILLPFFFSLLLAALLLPVVNFLESRKIPRILCILISLITSLILLFGILYFLATQVSNFLDDSTLLKDKLDSVVIEFKRWISRNFHVAIREQNRYLKDTAENIKTSGPEIVSQTLVSITEMISYFIFIPIYTFLLLHYKELIKNFLVTVFSTSTEKKVVNILHECQTVSQHYILGLLIEMTIVFALNAVCFLLLGIQYAIFLALVAALLNLVPYVGMLVANVFCMLITLISSPDPSNVLWVFAALMGVQLIDNNILMPFIVGTRVRINALATIMGVLIGGALCGVPGMFLAIPGVAVTKVIFDRVDGLKPWGMLMGDVNGHRHQLWKQRKKAKADLVESSSVDG